MDSTDRLNRTDLWDYCSLGAPRGSFVGSRFSKVVSIKGLVILDSMQSLKERNGEHKCLEVIESLEEDDRRILAGTILSSSWYPLDVFVRFLAADLNATAGGDAKVLVARTEQVVGKQLRGVYRVFVRLSSVESVIQRLNAVHRSYFQGVTIATERVAKNHFVVTYTGFEPQHRMMRNVIVGFFRKTLSLCGAKQVEVRFTTPVTESRVWNLDLTWQ